jgi:cellulose synthase/poly-beta-1,6-N-acetylglucosamine synthase-like glycosyltransferase
VVADNCDDATASVALACGATVLERVNDDLRGKGYALEFGFRASLAQDWASAVVVVDADTEVSANLLEAFAARLQEGAKAVQAHYRVLNSWNSWRTRLMTVAFTCFHRVRSRARERLRVSSGIRGNGWCVTHAALAMVPYRAFSLVEDIEFGIDLGLAGVRVHYADGAWVAALMVSGEKAAAVQRQRWEHGRFKLIRSKVPQLLLQSTRHADRVCLDLAFDLLVLPLSYLVLMLALFTCVTALATAFLAHLEAWLWVASACFLCVSVYVIRGWRLSGIGLLGVADLMHVPSFILWKLLVRLRAHDSAEWVRTKRE